MSPQLLLATRNQGKIVEFRRILDDVAPGAADGVDFGVDRHGDLADAGFAPAAAAQQGYRLCRARGVPDRP